MKNWQFLCVTVMCLAVAAILALRSSADSPAKAGDVTESRVASAEGNDWLLNGRTFDAQHFSPLKQITPTNVSRLGLAWYLDIDSGMAIVSHPTVLHGIAYVTAPLSQL